MSNRATMCLRFIGAALILSACGAAEPAGDETAEASTEAALTLGVELAADPIAFMGAQTYSATIQMDEGVVSLPYKAIGAYGVMDGDIILGDLASLMNFSYEDVEGAGRLSIGARWPGGVVPYTIDRNLKNQARVTDAIAHWQTQTGIRFQVRTNEADYLRFAPGGGCSSYVGRIGGAQTITLADGCSTGNAIHEIGHTIGLWHEQSRVDRDAFVVVNMDNVEAGYENNFQTYVQSGSDGVDISGYDFGSVMHYPLNAFSKNGSATIEVLNPDVVTGTVGQRNGLSPGDLLTVGLLYCRIPGYPCAIQF